MFIIKGLLKWFSPDETIFSAFEKEMSSFIVISDTNTLEELSESIFVSTNQGIE